MRVYLDGQFFAEWDRGLAELAEFAGVEIERLSPDIGQLCARQLREINAACEAELAAIRAKYPESEVLSWAKQEDEARRWQAWADEDEPNPAEEPATPLVDMLAAERGMDKAELVGRIIAKADAYTQAVGVAVGKRQRLEDQLDAILAAHQLPPDDPAHLPAEEAVAQLQAVVW